MSPGISAESLETEVHGSLILALSRAVNREAEYDKAIEWVGLGLALKSPSEMLVAELSEQLVVAELHQGKYQGAARLAETILHTVQFMPIQAMHCRLHGYLAAAQNRQGQHSDAVAVAQLGLGLLGEFHQMELARGVYAPGLADVVGDIEKALKKECAVASPPLPFLPT